MKRYLVVVSPTDKFTEQMEEDARLDGMAEVIHEYDFIQPFYHFLIVDANTRLGAQQRTSEILNKINLNKKDYRIFVSLVDALSLTNVKKTKIKNGLYEIDQDTILHRELLHRSA